ncbi:PHP domain-containing protein [Bacillus cereus]|uniref:PHP domain-containing protein n=1 Tax=Bacillus thuringiensis TaxID=1428 RepID=UPI0026E4511F|nr:PHP domain-containing protein [Bacillus thuringiensis]MDO6628760.1 PHP domain-containing protein [Bacillus thuringiensis]MDO6659320.1 PHP domain-containing protein [Bacillus thuringiensis]MDO6698902.1 PHP domain-containing protein [Bacillus thuringiensis]MEC0031048.1 PHP domain-containing protein [Bacillus cereus]
MRSTNVLNDIRYENIHKHSKYSNIFTPDCVISPEDLAKRAVELGHKTLCTVEHGYAGNFYEYYDVAKKYGLKFIFGMEFYYVKDRFEKDKTNTHLLVLARNDRGRRALNRIMSESNKTGYYYKPRIDEELLFSLSPEDVLVTSACVASPVNKYKDYGDYFIRRCREHFKDNFYLEIQSHVHPVQEKYNKLIKYYHQKYDIPLIHANDTHYIYPEDAKDRDILLQGKGIFYDDEDGFMLDFPDSSTILQRYREQGVFSQADVIEAMKNTLVVDDFEEIVLNKDIKMPSLYPNLSHEEKVKKLKEIVGKEWNKDKQHIPKHRHKEYMEAIRFEMNIIEKTKMEDYFLLNYEVIKRAKEKGGVLTRTGRGSAPSFYLNKLLGFTEIDRLDSPITLYPTRFMSMSRILETKSLPDIDFNCANPEIFAEACKEVLGEDNVYFMTAFGTMKISAAFRNICRSEGMKMSEYNEVAKNLEEYESDKKWGKLIAKAKKHVGAIDSVSPHPCAYLLLDESISEEVGVIKVGNELCAVIDSYTSDVWKFLKNDFLKVTVWEIIADTFKLIGKPIPDIRELTRLVENNPKVWDLYEKGFTATLNQAGTDSGTPQVVQYRPQSIRELSAWVAAIRPSFQSMKQVFLNRQPFEYGIPEFDAILKEADNFVLYQENIMSTLVFSGFPEDETYGLLKAISKKVEGIIEPIHERFINGFVAKTQNEDNANKVWQIVEDAVGYGFNASHSLSVALDSIYGAYLKAEYPLEYYTVVLNIYEDDTKMTAKIMKELDYFGIKVSPIRFGKSRDHYSPDRNSLTIYKGLQSVKYLNSKIAMQLYELADKEYDSFLDLYMDILDNTSVNSKQMTILIKLDFFNDYGKQQHLLQAIEAVNSGKNRYSKTHTEKTKQKRIPLLREELNDIFTTEVEAVDIYEQVMFEKDVLGYATFTKPKVKPSYYVITEINTKWTPTITMYQIKTGVEEKLKMKKVNFLDDRGNPVINEGDIIRVEDTYERFKNKLVDGKWVQTEEVDKYLVSCTKFVKG